MLSLTVKPIMLSVVNDEYHSKANNAQSCLCWVSQLSPLCYFLMQNITIKPLMDSLIYDKFHS